MQDPQETLADLKGAEIVRRLERTQKAKAILEAPTRPSLPGFFAALVFGNVAAHYALINFVVPDFSRTLVVGLLVLVPWLLIENYDYESSFASGNRFDSIKL